MDLFVINRYKGDDDEGLVNQETVHLQKLKEKIEERKKAYTVNKKVDVFILKEPQPSDTEQILDQKNDLNILEIIDVHDKPHSPEDVQVNRAVKQKSAQEFKVLGGGDFLKKSKAKRVLPHWLSNPFSVSKYLQELKCKVEDQDWLHSTLRTTLMNEGVTHLFPVQEQVVPFVLKEHNVTFPFRPHDICVSAPTGSGKTLSFVLPIIQILMNQFDRHIRALIVLPVQELAAQVAKVFTKYCANTGLKVALLSGSTPLFKEQQQIIRYTESLGWVSAVDIVVCTAGRLVEHLQNTEGFSLSNLKFLVIDEADRIMDNIQNDWLYHMERHIKADCESFSMKISNLNWNSISSQKILPHKLLFSATLSPDPELLEQWGLFQPKLFSASPINDSTDENVVRKYTLPDELQEHYLLCTTEEKPLIMFHYLVEQHWDKVLCFTNSAQSAHRLTVLLNIWAKGKIKAAELSAALDRGNRETVLKKFTQSEINIIICTDALARGIDMPDCNYVISYDPPRNIKTYIHRVGRTGRAGRTGVALTILVQNQMQIFKEILNQRGKSELSEMKLQQAVIEGLTKSYVQAIHETKQSIKTEINSKVKKSIELKRGAQSKSFKTKHKEFKKHKK